VGGGGGGRGVAGVLQGWGWGEAREIRRATLGETTAHCMFLI